MSRLPLFYFDNPVARNLTQDFCFRNKIYTILMLMYGKSYKVYSSYVLFFEYFGLHYMNLV
jgi:hypothetical protein